jgi:hypothetical protein
MPLLFNTRTRFIENRASAPIRVTAFYVRLQQELMYVNNRSGKTGFSGF